MHPDKHKSQFDRALALHRNGDIDNAIMAYRQILQENQNHTGALHMLGVILTGKNNLAAAEQLLRRAVKNSPDHPGILTSLGQTLLKIGNIEAAKKCFDQALKLEPDHAAACFNLGKIKKAENALEDAKNWFEKTLKKAPSHIAARNNLGNVLQQLDDQEGAEKCFKDVLRQNPNLAEPLYNLGNIYRLKNDYPQAAHYYEQSIEKKPDFAPAYLEMGRTRLAERDNNAAERFIRQAIRLDKTNAEAYATLGNLYLREGRIEEAVPLFLKSIHLQPEIADVHASLGNAYSIRGANSQARASLEKALDLDPDNAHARFQYGNLLESTGNKDEALEAYRHTMNLAPDNATQIFYYLFQLEIKLGILNNYDIKLKELIERTEAYLNEDESSFDLSPLILNYFPVPEDMHRQVATKRSELVEKNMASVKQQLTFTYPETIDKRLRIGYISPDFREHAVGIVINDIFRHHDREKVEVFAYSLVDIKDKTNEKLRAECEHFTDISKISPSEGAKIINQDQPHVLIDFAGYTTFSRPEVLALRPAPIQATAIGYPNTTGASFIEYILADKWLIPEDKQNAYTEKVVYLPHGFPSSPFEISDKKMNRPEMGLPDDAFVFCCFNAVYKMEPRTLDAWAEILRRSPDALLWLSIPNENIQKRILTALKQRHIASAQIRFADKLPHPEYMARYQLADLFLDTFLYTAGSTAICALHGGLPVLTRIGPTNSACMGASINAAAGMEEMICQDTETYIKRAVHLAHHPEEISEIKSKLTACQKTAPLFDAATYTRSIEVACQKMWALHAAGRSPEHLAIEVK